MTRAGIALVALLGSVTPLSGQTADTKADAAAWKPVLRYVLEQLSSFTLQAATDTGLQPWRFTLPDGPPLLRDFEHHVRMMLRARDVAPTDSLHHALEIGPLDASGDSARVRVTISESWRCPRSERLGGYTNAHELRVPRTGSTSWGDARAPGVLHGDLLCLTQQRELNELMKAGTAFQSIDSAAARGYRREVKECLIHEHHGAMGYHHVNPQLMDAKLEAAKPEILLYERVSAQDYRLVAAEYIVPFSAWARDSTQLYIMEQPLKRDDNLRIWYLHVWAWKKNPEGMFANFHPDVTCPPGDAKVFRPTER